MPTIIVTDYDLENSVRIIIFSCSIIWLYCLHVMPVKKNLAMLQWMRNQVFVYILSANICPHILATPRIV